MKTPTGGRSIARITSMKVFEPINFFWLNLKEEDGPEWIYLTVLIMLKQCEI